MLMDKLRRIIAKATRASTYRRLLHTMATHNYSQNGFAVMWLCLVGFAMFLSWRVNQLQHASLSGDSESVISTFAAETKQPVPEPQIIAVPPAPPVPEDIHQIGFSAGDLVNYNQAELDSRLNNFVSLGVKWIRLDVPWSVVQPDGPSSYHWESYDRVIDSANKHRLKVLVILDYTPKWARPSNCQESQYCAPADPNKFAEYARQVVERYKGKGVKNWEVWNEPNHKGFWDPVVNSTAYTTLLKVTYNAVKKADPSATVISGGLAPAFTQNGDVAPAEFMTAIYRNGGKGYFDAVAHHAYTYPALPSWGENWTGWNQMLQLRNIMNANGDTAKKIWITEYGAPTNGPGAGATAANFNFASSPDHVDENLQSMMVKESITMYRGYDWVGPMFWYQYKDKGTSTASNENFFGLLRHDGSKKPAYHTFNSLVKQ